MSIARLPDGRELYYERVAGPAGSGAPTVVFESGLAASRSFWGLVQPAVAAFADSVCYDRSGLGRSPASSGPRHAAQLAADLGGLLDHLGQGPFVLVGHSWGGPIVRLAAAAEPARIAGVVLVDATDELCELLFTEQVRKAERIGQALTKWLVRFRLLGLAYRRPTAALPPVPRADIRREGFTMAVVRTRAAELASVPTDLVALRDDPPVLHGIPVTTISGALDSPGMPRGTRAAATESHRRRALVSTDGRHVLAPKSGHLVPLTDAELIAAEIQRMITGRSS
ncbi:MULTISPECIES: alpha/beta fold hydrolase [unclassified Crossiella]|uniref:alpha/beta fold hydrolase n=1 Tax=unclassified Crossiella TaxID=2620835 RepID=UPI001FFFD0F4|nr:MULTISPECIES: alpha/beta hydrolase [unclassified Crossiella]MCK2243462.1 alpha/beta hydrolase [Crossiella sp. S99.2]MCK2257320.1 alpha/beta hydrolase [Crossiella sp. S99.1]